MRLVTGRVIRGLTEADIAGLGIADLTTAIRPGLTPQECLANLRRAAAARQAPPRTSTAVPLEDLALTSVAAGWAQDTLSLMANVAEGELGGSALRHACLEGPPGTGKTTIAAALAHSAGWSFVSTSVGTWFAVSGGHLGDVIRAARKFFDELTLAKGPVVGLIDELDALPNRATMDRDDASWWTPVITFVLTEIDRVRKSGQPVLLVAATNHFGQLDAALTRPGRLERRVSVLLPDEGERRAMFGKVLGDRLLAKSLATLARLSSGATPAQIESWCAAALATANGQNRTLLLRDLLELIAPRGQRSAGMDRAIALHEAGHAIVAHDLGLPVLEISIIGAGAVGGWVNTRTDDQLLTRDGVERTGTLMLAGRAADMLLGDGAHAGAAHDLENVNALLRSAMLDFGLYGSLTTGANTDLRNFEGGSFWSLIGAETDRLLARASEIVDRRRDDVRKLIEALLVERVVTGERLDELLRVEAEGQPKPADEAHADIGMDATALSGRR
jgi:ATP-dependent Zn protease